MALHTYTVTVIGKSGTLAVFDMPQKDEHGQPYTRSQVDVLADYKAKKIGYSGKYRTEVR